MDEPQTHKVTTRLIRADECNVVADIIGHFASQAILLWRKPEDIASHLDSFAVAEVDGEVIGCVALQDYGKGLMELRSLAVRQEFWGQGIGSHLIQAAIDLAKKREAVRIFALTKRSGLFLKNGFSVTDKEHFPQKVWNDCNLCAKKDNCIEIAVEMDLTVSST